MKIRMTDRARSLIDADEVAIACHEDWPEIPAGNSAYPHGREKIYLILLTLKNGGNYSLAYDTASERDKQLNDMSDLCDAQ